MKIRERSFEGLLGCAVASCALLLSAYAEQASSGCQREMIAMIVSPDDVWVAMVQEEVCSGPGIATTGVSDIVQLVRRGQEPRDNDDVFAIEEHGDPANRPVMQWLSAQKLQITVPNKSLIGLNKGGYKGVEIAVRYEPNDPVARQQWLRGLGLAPK